MLCSSGITFVRVTPGHVRHPFKQMPPVSGFGGAIHSLISGFLTLVILFTRKTVYYSSPSLHTASVMFPPSVEEIQEVPVEGPSSPSFTGDTLTTPQ